MERKIKEILEWEFESRGRGTPKGEFQRERFVQHLAFLGNIRKKTKVLSVGCGTGFYEFSLNKYTDHLHCLDASTNMLNICSKRQLRRLIRATSSNLPFKSNTFDCVYALSLTPLCTYQNKHSKTKTIAEMRRVSKRGGRIIIGHPTAFWKKLHGLFKYRNPDYDVFRASLKEIEELYKENKIELEKALILPSIPFRVLRRIDYLKIDHILSPFLFGCLGPYMFACGSK